MSNALQNRLVGTIVIVALAVIFLPDLLDGQKSESNTTFVAVPTPPDRKALVQPKEFPSEEVAAAASRPLEIVDEQPLDEQFSGSEPVEPETAAPTNGQPNADLKQQTNIERDTAAEQDGAGWVVQLGSFRHQKNVRELLDKLEDAGYRAYSKPVETSVGRLTKVFVGPDLQRQKLQDALPHLKQITGLSGKITEFKV
ncbi:SPOR domain-containing protein [Alteromonas oceanisediminis]|uniref:SPOR domain-containing protein n=1 Tax=Alteromonas oceanisediminis TaxID=2836180 RepID=UPI001BDAD24C|nr:SPOR domain-containing protein [Alteromonas oceanisediminis]MBT0587421.1 SPOR domain-containing protein [Alteromonas oceanisediminis]